MAFYLGTNKVNCIGLQPGSQLGYMDSSKLIAEKTFSFPLSNTNYSTLTISTSSQTLTLPATTYTTNPSSNITVFKLGENYDGTIINKTLYDYVCFSEGSIVYKYTVADSVINELIHGIKTQVSYSYHYGRYHPITSSGLINETTWTTSGTSLGSTNILLYRKVNGTYATTSSNGIYTSNSPSISVGTSSSKDYINLTLSSIYAKANNSYFPVEAMNYIDPTKTILSFTWRVYAGNNSPYSRIYQTAYNNVALE